MKHLFSSKTNQSEGSMNISKKATKHLRRIGFSDFCFDLEVKKCFKLSPVGSEKVRLSPVGSQKVEKT